MTRIIKFRAKGLDGSLVYFDLHESHLSGDAEVFYVGNVPCVAGSEHQYTGLKDENGKEIFEGDIIRTLQPGSDNEYETGNVYWCESSAGFYVETELSNDELSAFTDGEVIGNIYQDSELLKGEKE